MTFQIDTGLDPQRGLIPDWFWDTYSSNDVPIERAVHDYAYHLIGAMQNPAKMETVRKHVLAQWHFVRALADMHPEIFDEFWTSYAERVLA